MKQIICGLLLITGAVFSSCGKKEEKTKPIRKDVTETVFASGVLEAAGTYELKAQSDGYISRLYFAEGDTVSKGQIIAEIDNKEKLFNSESASELYNLSKYNTQAASPVLLQAHYSLETALKKMKLDSIQYNRYERLLEANSISQSEYDNALLQFQTSVASLGIAKENYRHLQQQAEQALISDKAKKSVTEVLSGFNRLRAQANGKVYKKFKEAGDFVQKGDVIALLGDSKDMYAKVNIDEVNVNRIRPGQKAFIQLNVNSAITYAGQVEKLYPSFDDASQSFICKIRFSDSLDFKISGTQLQVNIVVADSKNSLLIPRNYLDYGGLVRVKGEKAPRIVSTGFIGKDWVEVFSGLDEQTTIVTSNIQANKMATSEVGSQMK